ncbi:hypothetical protein Nepgr_017706 [Nepenthes gracilis]|uniref:Uncharacterized protein n=1 Tax=Nepenthes gracilis TaxID=150966 RepID=A0AAD3SRY3_NEPGR|nr:hypothetical protein Nepgr_017706 [Nepenthes gracilis]
MVRVGVGGGEAFLHVKSLPSSEPTVGKLNCIATSVKEYLRNDDDVLVFHLALCCLIYSPLSILGKEIDLLKSASWDMVNDAIRKEEKVRQGTRGRRPASDTTRGILSLFPSKRGASVACVSRVSLPPLSLPIYAIFTHILLNLKLL